MRKASTGRCFLTKAARLFALRLVPAFTSGHGLRHSLVSIYDEIDFGARRLVHEIVQLVARIHFVARLTARKQFLGNELLCQAPP